MCDLVPRLEKFSPIYGNTAYFVTKYLNIICYHTGLYMEIIYRKTFQMWIVVSCCYYYLWIYVALKF